MSIDDLFEKASDRDTQAGMEANRLTSLVKEVNGVRNEIAFLKSEIHHLLNDPEYDPDYPELLKVIREELQGMLNLFPEERTCKVAPDET
jgi:hypothetical protein